ncbi:MAG: ABC transporter ATP-binding protein [Anaerolineales bacterium]|nr:ABC transporter ATP-binding protein [Anaerolineales bacterium]
MLIADRVSHAYATTTGPLSVLDSVSLFAASGEFLALVGPSGSGKSTLLRVLAGLITPDHGQVLWRADVKGTATPLALARPRLGMMFQTPSLMPWRSALDNVLLPLEVGAASELGAASLNRDRAQEWLARVGLAGFEHALPRDLSGGMQSRVALARALMSEPDLLLLDEPFAGLDALTREQIGLDLAGILADRATTVVMVTHSIPEALLLADRVLVLGPRPARLRRELRVPGARPRGLSWMEAPGFTALATEVRAALQRG